MRNKYGHFSPDGMEYIITRPDTPRPWINYLTNENYCAICSHTGGGYSFVGESGYNRLTREDPGETLLSDRPGRYIYIRDNDQKQFWTLNWQPVMREDYQKWQAAHGLGYTKISSTNKLIESEICYFVPRKDNVEFWMLRIKNCDRKTRNLSIYAYIEWVLASYIPDLTDRNFCNLFNRVFQSNNIIYATKRRWERPDKFGNPWDKWAFFAMDQKIDGFECIRENFIGRYNYLSNPRAVVEGKCTNQNSEGEDSVGVFKKNLKLMPGQEIKINLILGATKKQKNIRGLVEHYFQNKTIDKEFIRTQQYWKKYIEKLWIKTPDSDFNLSVNIWNKYQAWLCAHWYEMDSYYIGGEGIFGFRDECQHLLGVLPLDLKFVKKRLITLMEHQFHTGHTVHNWRAITNKGVVTQHSDDAQWLAMIIINYLKESGDLKFLRKKVKFYDKKKGTVWEHLIGAINYTLRHSSKNDIPYRRTADWNDAITGGRRGKGESVMVAGLLAWNIKELIQILPKINKIKLIKKFEKIYKVIQFEINEHFWDGKWYARATDDSGHFIGSHRNNEGIIHLDAQTWQIISGIAYPKKAKQAMDSVQKLLDTPYGPLIFDPPYTQLNKALGIVSQFIPGTKENGTIFNHLVSWAVIAYCILGNAKKAYNLWKKSSFITRGKNPDLYKVEPYVYAEYIYGPAHERFGEGSYTWITGSAAWFLRTCTDWILGIKPTIDGLKINPCFPSEWKKYQIKRNFRGASYNIEVIRKRQNSNKVRKIFVNGKKMAGQILPILPKGEHKVLVEIG